MNKHTFHGICRNIWRSIVRSSTKSILVILTFFAVLLTLGWLQETITRNEAEITRLYETTYVFGQIAPSNPNIVARDRGGEVITRQILDEIVTSDLVEEISINLTVIEFTINPELNREMSIVRERIEEIIKQSGTGLTSLVLDLQDEELRFVLQPMEENLALLWRLYPVVVVVSMLIAAGLSFFLTLQNTKNVAVMSIFGATRKRIGILLWTEQIALCLSGLLLGVGLFTILSWGFGVSELLMIAGLCLFSVMAGSAFGLNIIIRRAPLDLLQVKE